MKNKTKKKSVHELISKLIIIYIPDHPKNTNAQKRLRALIIVIPANMLQHPQHKSPWTSISFCKEAKLLSTVDCFFFIILFGNYYDQKKC